jgi:hypothetical protein
MPAQHERDERRTYEKSSLPSGGGVLHRIDEHGCICGSLQLDSQRQLE